MKAGSVFHCLVILLCILLFSSTAYAVDNYHFEVDEQNEFYNTEPAHDTSSGTQVVYPNETATENTVNPYPNYNNAGSGSITPLSSSLASMISQTQEISSSSIQSSQTSDNNTTSYPLTAIEDLIYSNGSIGTLTISKLGVNVRVYNGDTFTAMAEGVGHYEASSVWNGNCVIFGHNRGVNNYFGQIHTLKRGDKITYTTRLGTRTYKVVSVDKISATDWSKLQFTYDNRITLVTCVTNDPDRRWCVQAIEEK